MHKANLFLFLLLTAGICCHHPNKSQEERTIETTIPLSEIQDKQLPEEFILNNGQTARVEDTIRYQLGGKLYYPAYNPEDSITVIEANYIQEKDGSLYREYHFIVHNTNTPEHAVFQTQKIDSLYKNDLNEVDYTYFLSLQDTFQIKTISPAIEKYKGYWIFLTYSEEFDDYFLYNYWGYLLNACITDSLYLKMYMDGVTPYRIISFEEDDDNGFIIEHPESIYLVKKKRHYRLIDKERQIYADRENGSYMTPSGNANKFKVVVSINNTGDMIY